MLLLWCLLAVCWLSVCRAGDGLGVRFRLLFGLALLSCGRWCLACLWLLLWCLLVLVGASLVGGVLVRLRSRFPAGWWLLAGLCWLVAVVPFLCWFGSAGWWCWCFGACAFLLAVLLLFSF